MGYGKGVFLSCGCIHMSVRFFGTILCMFLSMAVHVCIDLVGIGCLAWREQAKDLVPCMGQCLQLHVLLNIQWLLVVELQLASLLWVPTKNVATANALAWDRCLASHNHIGNVCCIHQGCWDSRLQSF